MTSKLQQFILEACMEGGGAISRTVIDKNHAASSSKSLVEHYKKIITQSIERLIARGLLIGYGTKTQKKLYITKIKLTARGKKTVLAHRKMKQQKLPYVRNKNRSV